MGCNSFAQPSQAAASRRYKYEPPTSPNFGGSASNGFGNGPASAGGGRMSMLKQSEVDMPESKFNTYRMSCALEDPEQ